MNELAKVALDIARDNLGKREATGKNDGPFVAMIQRWLDKGAGWMERQPWCAAFATWCVHQAAKRLGVTPSIPRSGSSTSLYQWAAMSGNLLPGPEGICIGLIKGSGGTKFKTHHHTFIANALHIPQGQGWVWGIDGNWKNAVTRTQHKIKDCDFIRIV
jgi:hypothetical protein